MTLPHFEQYTLLPPYDPAKAKREYGRGILRCADQPVNTESSFLVAPGMRCATPLCSPSGDLLSFRRYQQDSSRRHLAGLDLEHPTC